MSEVHLTGELVCTTDDEARIVSLHFPEHIERTQAVLGCALFRVTATGDPLIWLVEERFTNQRAFELHKARASGSEWGRVTAGIERRYAIEEPRA